MLDDAFYHFWYLALGGFWVVQFANAVAAPNQYVSSGVYQIYDDGAFAVWHPGRVSRAITRITVAIIAIAKRAVPAVAEAAVITAIHWGVIIGNFGAAAGSGGVANQQIGVLLINSEALLQQGRFGGLFYFAVTNFGKGAPLLAGIALHGGPGKGAVTA